MRNVLTARVLRFESRYGKKKNFHRLTYNGKRRHWVHLFTIQNEALDQEFPTKGASIDEMNF